jgi:hypothetical protein
MDQSDILDLAAKHQWILLSAVVLGCIVRLLKEDTRFPPFAVAARWRPLLAMGLGIASGALHAVATGTPWRDALLGGLVSGSLAIAGHGTIVDGFRDGKDVPMPGLTKPREAANPRGSEPTTPTDPSVPRA